MASCHHRLIQNLRKQGLIKDQLIEEVMLSVDRSHFSERNPSSDSPQPIGYGVTISAPHMHAIALEALKHVLRPGATALDVGSGSGYLTACMAKLVSPDGKVVGIEHVNQLVQKSIDNCNKDKSISVLMESKVLLFVKGDGRQGYLPHAPYDAIHVGAAAEQIPDELIAQLKPGGRFICPIGLDGFSQSLVQIDKTPNGQLVKKEMMGVRYVPLTDLKKQLGSFGGF